jgi:hypothetical protein
MDTVGGRAFGIVARYLLLQRFPGNQAIHPLPKHLTAGLALLALVLDIGEGDLVHEGESCTVGQNRIIAYSEGLFRGSLTVPVL